MKPLVVLLGALLATGSVIALRLPDEATLPPEQMLSRESASPHRWADVGDTFLTAGKRDQARQAYARALELAPHIPQVWVRDANFHFQLDEPGNALKSAVRVLHIVNDYDDILFSYFDRLIPEPATILSEIGADRRAAQSYTEHLIASGNMDAAQIAWKHLGFKDQRLTTSYIDALLAAHRYTSAQALGCPSICNASFETEPTGSTLDWRIQPSDQFETVRDNTVAHSGKWSLRIRFQGTGNVSYANVSQTIILSPGQHHLRAWVRTENITTYDGPRIAVLNAQTEPIIGTHDWMLIELPFTVPSQTNAIQVRVIRTPSMRFDNKIEGTFWLDSLTLE